MAIRWKDCVSQGAGLIDRRLRRLGWPLVQDAIEPVSNLKGYPDLRPAYRAGGVSRVTDKKDTSLVPRLQLLTIV